MRQKLGDYLYEIKAIATNFLLANPEEIVNQVNTNYCNSQA
jgi:hypothetical protein